VQIETSLKQALHTLGAYAYHFCMLDMIPISRKRSGDPYLHRYSLTIDVSSIGRWMPTIVSFSGPVSHRAAAIPRSTLLRQGLASHGHCVTSPHLQLKGPLEHVDVHGVLLERNGRWSLVGV